MESNYNLTFSDITMKKLISFTLGVRQMMQRSDHSSIVKELKQLLELLQISSDQVERVATDGGGNVKKAVSSMFGEAAQSPCICHMLNLVVEYTFEMSPIITAILKDVKAIVTFFKMSPVAMNMLKNIQLDKGKKCLVLIQSVPTRWNSQLNCLKRYVKLKDEVKKVLTDPSLTRSSKATPPNPVPDEAISMLDEVVKILQPLDDLTRAFSANKTSTSSLVLLFLKDTHQNLTGLQIQTNAISDFRQILTNKLGCLIENLDQDESLSCAQLVDPRYYNFAFVT
jgi:hypothetical protein